ncbi:hypothetical protein J6590_093134 [Homalodisca vitripennis]|nr:hypothetical protein J6590_089705 [Homalodisca vitripennis]KAG8294869.1 hypothetical protein J6590_093134 [Homalodisca vitripennis]
MNDDDLICWTVDSTSNVRLRVNNIQTIELSRITPCVSHQPATADDPLAHRNGGYDCQSTASNDVI